jgi:DNA (cytosine-5)-methyltransferase 1
MTLNAADYGVGQMRHRVFFVGFHKDLGEINYTQPVPTHGPKTKRSYVTLEETIGDMEEWPEGDFFDGKFHGHFLTRNRKRTWDQPSFTIVAHGHHSPLHPIGEPMSFVSKDKWRLNGTVNRRLSWKECVRIQGLPDSIEIDGCLLDKYKVVGNSVPPKLAQIVTKPAIDILKNLI